MLCGYSWTGHDYRQGQWTVPGHVEQCLLHALVEVGAVGVDSPVVLGREWGAFRCSWLGPVVVPESGVWVAEGYGALPAGLLVRAEVLPQEWRSVGIQYSLWVLVRRRS